MTIVHCSSNVASDASTAFDTFYQTNKMDCIVTTLSMFLPTDYLTFRNFQMLNVPQKIQ